MEDWNNLDIGIRSLATLSAFKRELQKRYFYVSNTLFNIGSGYGHINHARIHMGLSALNSHRTKYNFISHSTCPKCGSKPENEIHFFLQCPNYANQRAVLMGTLTQIIRTNAFLNLETHPRSKAQFSELNTFLIFGDSNLTKEDNTKLFTSVQKFIVDSKRF